MTQRLTASLGWIVLCVLMTGCAVRPASIVIYEDRRDSIWLKFDPEARLGHSHPATINPEQLTRILRGVWVRHRDIVGGVGLFADQEGMAAFSAFEITRLAPYLSQALKKASPKDMVTFYLTTADPTHGKLVTSGGLFVRKERLYLILANVRTSPSSVQYENTYQLDTRDEPLLPIARYKFLVGFTPDSARISNVEARRIEGYEPYLDESKLLVIDLQRLMAETEPPVSPSKPPSSQPHP